MTALYFPDPNDPRWQMFIMHLPEGINPQEVQFCITPYHPESLGNAWNNFTRMCGEVIPGVFFIRRMAVKIEHIEEEHDLGHYRYEQESYHVWITEPHRYNIAPPAELAEKFYLARIVRSVLKQEMVACLCNVHRVNRFPETNDRHYLDGYNQHVYDWQELDPGLRLRIAHDQRPPHWGGGGPPKWDAYVLRGFDLAAIANQMPL